MNDSSKPSPMICETDYAGIELRIMSQTMADMDRVKTTPAQRTWIGRANDRGRILYMGKKGYGSVSWEKSMEALVGSDLLRRDTAARALCAYLLTDKGRAFRAGMVAADAVAKRLSPGRSPNEKWGPNVRLHVLGELNDKTLGDDFGAALAGARGRWLDLVARRAIQGMW